MQSGLPSTLSTGERLLSMVGHVTQQYVDRCPRLMQPNIIPKMALCPDIQGNRARDYINQVRKNGWVRLLYRDLSHTQQSSGRGCVMFYVRLVIVDVSVVYVDLSHGHALGTAKNHETWHTPSQMISRKSWLPSLMTGWKIGCILWGGGVTTNDDSDKWWWQSNCWWAPYNCLFCANVSLKTGV